VPNPCPTGWVSGPYTTFFEGTSIPSWAAIEKPASMDVSVADGKLTFDPYGGGAAYASFYVNGLIDCHERMLRVHLLEVPRIGDRTEVVIDWFKDPDNSVHVGVSYGDLQWITWIGGTQNWIGEPFDGSEMYWGLREEAGTLTFEVSADGVTWRELHRMSSPGLLSSCSPGIGSGTDGPISNPGQAVIDEFLDCVKE
jgi:hypothetical protein